MNLCRNVLQNCTHFDTDSYIKVSLLKYYYLPNNIMLFNTLGEIIEGFMDQIQQPMHR